MHKKNRYPFASVSYALVLPVVICAFCAWYLGNSYDSLVRFYKNLNSCFYGAGHWQELFFSPAVKATGNLFCLAGILLAGTLALLNLKKAAPLYTGYWLKKSFGQRAHLPALLLIIAGCTALWIWGNRLTGAATDEVFSAANFAALPAFQTISYYALPNNHIFFNLINHFCSPFLNDALLSGKLISLGAYVLLISGNYLFLKRYITKPCLLWLVLAALSVQFTTWGFGYQARGYALYTFFEWLAFASLFRYLTTQDPKYLGPWLLANVLGCWTIPSFVYWIGSEVVIIAGTLLATQRRDKILFRYLLYAGILVFIVYLPVLTFSGLHALSENRYVSTGTVSLSQFLDAQGSYFLQALHAGISIANLPVWTGLLLILVPAAALISVRDRMVRQMIIWNILLWLILFTMILGMKRIPFFRNLSGHYHIALIVLLLALYSLYNFFSNVFFKLGYLSIFACFCCFVIVKSWTYHKQFAAERLYYYNTRQLENEVMQISLPVSSPQPTVFVSDEGFFCAYVLHRKYPFLRIDRNNCNFKNQDFCILEEDEHPDWLEQYTLIEKRAAFLVYAKNRSSSKQVEACNH